MVDERTVRVKERLEPVEARFVDGPWWQVAKGAKTKARLKKGSQRGGERRYGELGLAVRCDIIIFNELASGL
jgi:hypothetical protein